MQSSAGVTPGVTNANGVAKFAVSDAKTEVVTYTATDGRHDSAWISWRRSPSGRRHP